MADFEIIHYGVAQGAEGCKNLSKEDLGDGKMRLSER
jgi:hypothetical protein